MSYGAVVKFRSDLGLNLECASEPWSEQASRPLCLRAVFWTRWSRIQDPVMFSPHLPHSFLFLPFFFSLSLSSFCPLLSSLFFFLLLSPPLLLFMLPLPVPSLSLSSLSFLLPVSAQLLEMRLGWLCSVIWLGGNSSLCSSVLTGGVLRHAGIWMHLSPLLLLLPPTTVLSLCVDIPRDFFASIWACQSFCLPQSCQYDL